MELALATTKQVESPLYPTMLGEMTSFVYSARERSLTKRFLPEFRRLLAVVSATRLADGWEPGFRVRRNRTGEYCGFWHHDTNEVVVYVTEQDSVASVFQTIAHELSHGLTPECYATHGDVFQRTLRTLMHTRWGGLYWMPSLYADEGEYAADRAQEDALEHAFPELRAPVV